MSERDRFLTRFQQRLAGLAPAIRRAWLRGIESLRDLLPDSVLRGLIHDGPEALVAETLTPAAIDRAFLAYRLDLRHALESTIRWTAKGIPINPNIMGPLVQEAVLRLDTRVMTTLSRDIQTTVRAAVLDGIANRQTTAQIGRTLRAVVPLAPSQYDAIANFRGLLETGNLDALRRALRDRRFDKTLQRALGRNGTGLSATQIDRMVEAYERRMIAYNADLYAKTTTLDAMRQGQWLAWRDAIAQGTVNAAALWKQWQTMGDDKVRASHQEMNGETQPAEGLYSNGEFVPGESTWNCRCLSYFFERTSGDA